MEISDPLAGIDDRSGRHSGFDSNFLLHTNQVSQVKIRDSMLSRLSSGLKRTNFEIIDQIHWL